MDRYRVGIIFLVVFTMIIFPAHILAQGQGDPCQITPASGQDFDQDGIDDACDGFVDEAPPPPPPPVDEEPVDIPDIVVLPIEDPKPGISNETVAGNEVLVDETRDDSVNDLQPQPAPPQTTSTTPVQTAFARNVLSQDPAPVLGTSTADQITTETFTSNDPAIKDALDPENQESSNSLWVALAFLALIFLVGFVFFRRFRTRP